MTKKKRRSVNVKEQAVMRLFRGEDMELVSRETGCTMHDLKQWRDKYKLAGRKASSLVRGTFAIPNWNKGIR